LKGILSSFDNGSTQGVAHGETELGGGADPSY
jgi:hypothetical protein